MRELDENGLALCRFQAEMFEKTIDSLKCSSPIFVRRFMYSDVACRMDSDGFLCEPITQIEIIRQLNEEYGETEYGKNKYNPEEMYWIGYIYRYWCYTKGINSKQLYRMVKPSELQKLYYPYHSLDPAQAIERIVEANELQEDEVTRGVEILRRIRSRK